MLRPIVKRIISPILQLFWKIYTSYPHKYSYEDLRLTIEPGVFHPAFFLSTGFFVEFIRKFPLQNQTVWELGCGSGLISMVCARAGAQVLATDISPQVIATLKKNLKLNPRILPNIQVARADLFQGIPLTVFNFIIVNPPYYPRAPKNDAERAFYCGEGFEYFVHFFEGIGQYMSPETYVFMVLSEDCQIATIQDIGRKKGYSFSLVAQKKMKGEENFIFQIRNL